MYPVAYGCFLFPDLLPELPFWCRAWNGGLGRCQDDAETATGPGSYEEYYSEQEYIHRIRCVIQYEHAYHGRIRFRKDNWDRDPQYSPWQLYKCDPGYQRRSAQEIRQLSQAKWNRSKIFEPEKSIAVRPV